MEFEFQISILNSKLAKYHRRQIDGSGFSPGCTVQIPIWFLGVYSFKGRFPNKIPLNKYTFQDFI